jgi:hypothetical protein
VSLVTVAGLSVIHGTWILPLTGSWRLEATLEATEALSGPVNVVVAGDGAPNVVYDGVVARSWAPAERVSVVVVGGRSGGLSTESELSRMVTGRHYDGDPVAVTAAELLDDLATETGEVLQVSAKTALESSTAESWHRPASMGRAALQRTLQGPPGAPWGLSARFLLTGELWAGVETWPDAPEELEYVDPIDDGMALHIAPRSARFEPGQRADGKAITMVHYTLTPLGLRARLYYDEAK